jgi:tetratricopeptide (TPR) repeat protein
MNIEKELLTINENINFDLVRLIKAYIYNAKIQAQLNNDINVALACLELAKDAAEMAPRLIRNGAIQSILHFIVDAIENPEAIARSFKQGIFHDIDRMPPIDELDTQINLQFINLAKLYIKQAEFEKLHQRIETSQQAYQQARATLNTVLKHNPRLKVGLIMQSRLLFTMNLYEDALKTLKALLLECPKEAEANYLHGLVLEKLGHSDEALYAFEAAIKYSPIDHLDAYFSRGRLSHTLGYLDDALDDFSHVAVCEDASKLKLITEANYSRGTILSKLYVMTNNPYYRDEAELAFDSALELNSKHVESLIARAKLHFQTGSLERAKSDCSTALQHGINDQELKSEIENMISQCNPALNPPSSVNINKKHKSAMSPKTKSNHPFWGPSAENDSFTGNNEHGKREFQP